jgi:hypothetical protein
MYNSARARYLVRGSLSTSRIYIVIGSPPSLIPYLDIFVIQHLFQLHRIHLRLGLESFI